METVKGKRLFDFFFSFSGLLLLWPLFFIIALFIKLDDRGPVFFKQERVGRCGQLFKIWKFRTMIVDAEKQGKQLTVGKDFRITRTGEWLRKFKLDELPQLINVLCGEMSLVGPRPEVPYYVAFYTPDQQKILTLKPGITDLASILYSEESEWLAEAEEPENTYIEEIMPEKLKLNMEYARYATVWNDSKVILRTFAKLVGKQSNLKPDFRKNNKLEM